MMKKLIMTFACFLLSVFLGCAPLFVQSPNDGYRPVNAVSMHDESRLMLFGYDIVSYYDAKIPKTGNKEFRSDYKGVVFWFLSLENKKLFENSPLNYLPQYGGYCANGIVYGIPWGGSPETYRIINGKLYIFGGESSQDAFLIETAKNIELADQYWSTEVDGSNAFWQRSKRMIFKVPHYKSGAELASLVAASKNK